MNLTLPLFKLRIFFIDHKKLSLPANDFTVCRTFFNRCSDFHCIQLFLLISKCNSAFCQIVWGHFNLYFIAGQDLDIVHSHLSGNVSSDDVPVLQLDPKHGIAKRFDDSAILLD